MILPTTTATFVLLFEMNTEGFCAPRQTYQDRPTTAAPRIGLVFSEPIKAMIGAKSFFGYRTVAWLLEFNRNTVRRIFQLNSWQVRKRPVGAHPRIEAMLLAPLGA